MKRSMDYLKGQNIFITGGTGSFGAAFVETLLRDGDPKKVIVFSRDEQKHHAMRGRMADPRLRFFVGDVRDPDRLKLALRGVDIVIHAAAMKHVPICEYNPIEAVRTNVDGTINLIQASLEAGVKRVVALSTDKAVAPVNLYGATKLCLEKIIIAANSYAGDLPTRFSVVRYGNVMGSAGSVIPLFKKQAAEKGKITITDERMTRFWIDMEQAISVVLHALATMEGGEVFVPKLPASDICTLAEAVAPGVGREVIGIRPGEKLHECLVAPEEYPRTYDSGEFLVIIPDGISWNIATSKNWKKVGSGFSYSSDRKDLQLKPDAVQVLVGEYLSGISKREKKVENSELSEQITRNN